MDAGLMPRCLPGSRNTDTPVRHTEGLTLLDAILPRFCNLSPMSKVWTNLDSGNKDRGGAAGCWQSHCSALGGFIHGGQQLPFQRGGTSL